MTKGFDGQAFTIPEMGSHWRPENRVGVGSDVLKVLNTERKGLEKKYINQPGGYCKHPRERLGKRSGCRAEKAGGPWVWMHLEGRVCGLLLD